MAGNIENGIYRTNVSARHQRGNRMRIFYMSSLVVAIIALILLMLNIINQSFGLVALNYAVDPDTLADRPLEELNETELSVVLVEQVPRQILRIVRDNLSAVPESDFTSTPLGEAVAGTVPEAYQDLTITDLTPAEQGEILALNMDTGRLNELIEEQVLQPDILQSWHLNQSVLNRASIEQEVEDKYPLDDYPNQELVFRSWLNVKFITSPLSAIPGEAGILPALLGTLWLVLITALVAFPLGVGAAIYLQEYANDSWLNKLIETNIRNLAGVPSIIYGMLGLAIFVRTLADITQGRTILSGGLTLALLILPIIIINSQEALVAVPSTIREASYGLGATQWQTIYRQVLPSAIPGIMTGTILAMSRAIGETAPLILVGAAAFINTNPDGPLSRFTALPILIYNWTAQPNDQFRNIAAAAIILLLFVLILMNSLAIYLRNRAVSKRV